MSVSPHRYAAALCVGLAAANVIRGSALVALGAAAALAAGTVAVGDDLRPRLLVAALLFLGGGVAPGSTRSTEASSSREWTRPSGAC